MKCLMSHKWSVLEMSFYRSFSQNTVLDSENMGRYGEWASTGLFPKFSSVYEKWLGLHSTVVKRFSLAISVLYWRRAQWAELGGQAEIGS